MHGHIYFIVYDGTNIEDLKRKFHKIPLMQEKKRKLFQLEVSNTLSIDWPKLKKFRRSMFQPLNLQMDSESLDELSEIYSLFRTEDDAKESDDVISVIIPGPLPNTPTNKNLERGHTTLSRLTPQHQQPKIGFIEVQSSDILRRVHGRSPFQGKLADHIIFTTQKKTTFERKQMKVLDGDTYFNKWQVATIPLTQMVKCTLGKYDLIFNTANKTDFMVSEDCPHTDMLTDESALADDQVVPFPHEHESKLALEQQNIFENKIFIDLAAGSGEKAKAYLSLGLWAVLVCMTPEHKADKLDFLMHRQTDRDRQTGRRTNGWTD